MIQVKKYTVYKNLHYTTFTLQRWNGLKHFGMFAVSAFTFSRFNRSITFSSAHQPLLLPAISMFGISVEKGSVMGVAALARTDPAMQSFTPSLKCSSFRMERNGTLLLTLHLILEVCKNLLNHSGLPV